MADTSKHRFEELKTPRGEGDFQPKTPVDGASATSSESRPKSDSEASPAECRRRPKSYRVTQLFRFAEPLDALLLGVGVLASAFRGAVLPVVGLLFGDIVDGFAASPVDHAAVNRATFIYLALAAGAFVTEYTAHVAFFHSAERQIARLRAAVLHHTLFLDAAWFDEHDSLQLASRFASDTVRIKGGMGVALGDVAADLSAFAVGVGIGLAKGWDIALAAASVTPVMVLVVALVTAKLGAKAERVQQLNAEAGAIAEETLRNVRTMSALSAQPRALASYTHKVRAAKDVSEQASKFAALGFAVLVSSIWVVVAIGLWFGGRKVAQGGADPGDVVAAFLAFLAGVSGLSSLSSSVPVVAEATGAAQALLTVLDTPSRIDASSDEGLTLVKCFGALEAVDVRFSYPSRPDVPVLKGLSVRIASGETVALVGVSGSGKSTLVALLARFYDPTSGALLVDGHDVRTLNVRWLRAQIGIVAQEPVLFATSIFENIAFGGGVVTREQVARAAKLANAHEFILRLPGQYDAVVGEQGVLLSGGQKQRLAIARAIMRKPKLLLLDEATSALDSESERAVQAALDALMSLTETTVLVVAHRLSTVRRADRILVLQDGRVAESGSHEQLLRREHGVYRNMCAIQQLGISDSDSDSDGSDDDTVLMALPSSPEHRDAAHEQRGETAAESNELTLQPFGLRDAAQLVRPERRRLAVGVLGSLAAGLLYPVQSVVLSAMIASLTVKYARFVATDDRTHLAALYDDCVLYSGLFLGGAVAMGFLQWLEIYHLHLALHAVLTRLQELHAAALCRQNVGFFDDPARGAGAFAVDLAVDARKVAVAATLAFSHVLQAAFIAVCTAGVSFAFGSWELTLVVLAVVPVVVLAQALRHWRLKTRDAVEDELAAAGSHSSEALSNVRTIAVLGIEKAVVAKYVALLEAPKSKGQAAAQINGVASGVNAFVGFAAQALVIWYGAKLVAAGDTTFERMLTTEVVVMMSLDSVMGVSAYLGGTVAAFKAGSRILSLAARHVALDPMGDNGVRLKSELVQGKIEFLDVEFRYPARSEVAVLQNLSLKIAAGETVAFCGASGGGKSTVVALIERFYDPVRGHVLLDDVCLRELNVRSLRAQIGLVGQEPTLFIGSIADNIALGVENGEAGGLPLAVTQKQVEAAARLANAHDFIMQFPDGYATQVGVKGHQLSGGQKQRIAIARAILKDPAVLILDEATSALDAENEKLVQDALDRVMTLTRHRRRTTLVITHRLSTIQHADRICVLSGGLLVEEGTHSELLHAGGMYAQLVASATL